MEFEKFEAIVKNGLSNLYDFATLETLTPLTELFVPPADYYGNKGDFVRKVILDNIEILKPAENKENINAPEWQSYIILTKRYVESQSTQDIAAQLSISERQLRRYLQKAVRALASLLWEKVQQEKKGAEHLPDLESPSAEFTINREEVDLQEVINGVIQLFSRRLSEEDIHIQIPHNEPRFRIENDRVIIRQILIGLMNILLMSHVNNISITLDQEQEQPVLTIKFSGISGQDVLVKLQDDGKENRLRYWCNELDILFEEQIGNKSSTGILKLHFPKAKQKTVLIVDDQEPALRMFTRYLSRTNLKIVGLNKATKVLSKAKELQPALILLDIMMPKVDGWELFQSLKLDNNTKHIPVIICSAWGEPDLAKSLGAYAFLSKPVTQRDLLSTIQSLGILD
jgi:CheY-like chemotaxis protein